MTSQQADKILISLTNHVYNQSIIGLLASLFCASIIFIGLYDNQNNNFLLFFWAGIFISITVLRAIAVAAYKSTQHPEKQIKLWRTLYIAGSLLGGASWGFLGFFLLPYATPLQQTLMVLIITGVTAGAVPLSAAIPTAAILFLSSSLLPLIISILLFENNVYFLFDAAVFIYFIYTIALTIKTYKLIFNSMVLQFENDELLNALAKSNIKLEYAATHDPLTQVANRTLFQDNLEKAIGSAKKNNKILALLYFDLDNFKFTNDRYGHEAGDLVLKVIIDRLINYTRKEDIIGRLGGDELAIILDNVTNKGEIATFAKRVCQLVGTPIKMKTNHLNVTASMGISVYPHDGQDVETLVRCADQCMYYAKKNGGNRFYFNEDVPETILESKRPMV